MTEKEPPIISLPTVLKPIASLKLTVVLFAMAIFIVFAGTVAQVDRGIWTVVDQYFRCYVAWIELGIFFPRSMDVPGGFYFPGGWLIGGLLMCNILAAHLIRFKISASGARLGLGLFVLAVGGVFMGVIVSGKLEPTVAATEDDAYWRVLWRLIKGGGVGVILLAGCILVFKKRAGVVLVHAGIIVMFVAEFVTGVSAIEARMRLEQGETKQYVERSREVELAVIDRSDPETDQVISVPQSRLERRGTIRDDALPFDIEVHEYMVNSDILEANSEDANRDNPATAGRGLTIVAVPVSESAGADTEQTVDVPSAYMTFKDKQTGDSLGTYLTSAWLSFRKGALGDLVTVGDQTYDVNLRFRRDYKPYALTLIDFRHEKYVGTETPKDFSSHVRLVDESQNVDREVRIWMNNPLRYAGETFYQASFEPGKNLTILQVVRNEGWMLPYLSCMMVGIGMLAHFGQHLVTFLRKRLAA